MLMPWTTNNVYVFRAGRVQFLQYMLIFIAQVERYTGFHDATQTSRTWYKVHTMQLKVGVDAGKDRSTLVKDTASPPHVASSS